jgi:hypothetical protein
MSDNSDLTIDMPCHGTKLVIPAEFWQVSAVIGRSCPVCAKQYRLVCLSRATIEELYAQIRHDPTTQAVIVIASRDASENNL